MKGIKSIKGTKSIEGSKSIKGDMKRFEDLIKIDLFSGLSIEDEINFELSKIVINERQLFTKIYNRIPN